MKMISDQHHVHKCGYTTYRASVMISPNQFQVGENGEPLTESEIAVELQTMSDETSGLADEVSSKKAT